MTQLEKYEIRPQKPSLHKKEFLKNFSFNLRAANESFKFDIEEFKQSIAFAKYKKIDLLKQNVTARVHKTGYFASELELDPLSYCAYTFFCHEEKMLEMLKYILANTDTKKHSKITKDLLFCMLKDKIYVFNVVSLPAKYYTRNGLKNCSPVFQEAFNLLLESGAEITQIIPALSEFEFANSDYADFLTMLVKYNNAEINNFLCEQIYKTSETQFLYDFLNKNNIANFSASYAIQKIKEDEKNIDVVKMLLQKGALDIRDFSAENVKKQMQNMTFYNAYEEQEFLNIFANLEKQMQKPTQKQPEKQPQNPEKYTTKKPLSEAEIAINNIFENAKDNVL